jgi:hypothetical protein
MNTEIISSTGPWCAGRKHLGDPIDIRRHDQYGRIVATVPMGEKRDDLRACANATLIASAPAMDIALRLLTHGLARIERNGTLIEFCFDGMRHIFDGDWTVLIQSIGWNKAHDAITDALEAA